MASRGDEMDTDGGKRKHQTVSIQQKVEILRKLDLGVSVNKISQEYGLGKSTVYDIKKHREKLLQFYSNSESKKNMCFRKSMRTSKSSEHDRMMMEWFRKCRSEGVELSGPLLMEQAQLFHLQLGLEHECDYTEGWLQKFKNRHGISFNKICKEELFENHEGIAKYVDENIRTTLTAKDHEASIQFKQSENWLALFRCSNTADDVFVPVSKKIKTEADKDVDMGSWLEQETKASISPDDDIYSKIEVITCDNIEIKEEPLSHESSYAEDDGGCDDDDDDGNDLLDDNQESRLQRSRTAEEFDTESLKDSEDSDELDADDPEEMSQVSDHEEGHFKRGESQEECGDHNEEEADPWNSTEFHPFLFPFKEHAGISTACSATEDSEELDYFLEFFNNDLIDEIVRHTNAFHEHLIHLKTYPPKSRMHQWEPTHRHEIYMFLCLCMTMVHVQKHRINDYWSRDFLTSTPSMGTLMSRDRFLLLLHHLNFSDNWNNTGCRLSRVRRVLDDLRHKFSTKFKPFQDLRIDEIPVLWRHGHAHHQHMPRKRINPILFLLRDVTSKYILDFILYTDSQVNIDPEFGFGGSVVKTLMEPYRGKGHNLYVDSLFVSLNLFEHLHQNSTGACGTVRPDRKGLPSIPKANQGDINVFHKKNVMYLKWSANQVVHMLTSIHENRIIKTVKRNCTTGEHMKSPEAFADFTNKMSTTDQSNTLVSCVDSLSKSVKWHKKLFFYLVDMARLNAYYMYMVKTDKRPSFLDFSHSMLLQMMSRFRGMQIPRSQGHRLEPDYLRLTERHFPSHIEATLSNPKPRRRCYVCANSQLRESKRQSTYFQCADCRVSLCMPECFRIYHTQEIY